MPITLPTITAHIALKHNTEDIRKRLVVALKHLVPALYGDDIELGTLNIVINEWIYEEEGTADLTLNLPVKLERKDDSRSLPVSNDTHRQLMATLHHIMGEHFPIIQPWPHLDRTAPSRVMEVIRAEQRIHDELSWNDGVIDTKVFVLGRD